MWRSEWRRRGAVPGGARRFPELEPYVPPGKTEAAQDAYLRELAESLVETECERDDEELDHPTMPAAYASLAVFVDHELSLGAPPCATRPRAPRLDLATVYGTGPDQSYLYDKADPARMLLDAPYGPGGDLDLPRNRQGKALIGDPRNDESLLTAQLHQVFLRFHNVVLAQIRERGAALGEDGDRSFARAQQLVRWHFQWVVLHDFLPRLVEPQLVHELLSDAGEASSARLTRCGGGRASLPIEFLLGAALACLSLQRARYDLNDRVGRRPAVCAGRPDGEKDLRGLRVLPEGWSVQWDRFVEIDGSRPQRCRRLDTHLPAWMHERPEEMGGSLLVTALRLGWEYGLPSGQSVARALGLRPAREGHDPLLAYILTEAEDPPSDGTRLDGVGARIVAEVMIGAMAGDPTSFLRMDRAWTPEFAGADGIFDLAQLLRCARVALTAADVPGRSRVPAPPLACSPVDRPVSLVESRI